MLISTSWHIRFARFAILVVLLIGVCIPQAQAAVQHPGDDLITVPLTDGFAGVTYQQQFELAYANTTADGTFVYIYVPAGALGVDGPNVPGLNPSFDPNTADDVVPCADHQPEDYRVTQQQVDALGDQLTQQIVRVDEEHFGPLGGTNALVMLAYNIQDEHYYDCQIDTMIGGYFAVDLLAALEMNVIVVDTLDWAADQVGTATSGVSSIVAHELEHLLMYYSDPGELNWVDEGLAEFAAALNGFDGPGFVAFHQIAHRETSLTRWTGALENYGAAYTFFEYLWEQAGGNGDGTYTRDLDDDNTGGDLLIKRIFQNPATSMEGVQAAIDAFNAAGHPGRATALPSAFELSMDWTLAVYLDDEQSQRFDIRAVDFGPGSWGFTIDVANQVLFDNRGIYKGAMPEAKWQHFKRVPPQLALPFGMSVESFRHPGPTFSVLLDGEDTTQIAPHSGTQHWYGGYENLTNNTLEVTSAVHGGEVIDFWTWYFIEEGWDYGFIEALVGDTGMTIPLTNDAGTVVTTDENPTGNNEEGNGLTGTSGGAYYVDSPAYIHLSGRVPAGATSVRFRYSTDGGYLDTGWFVDDVRLGGAVATLSAASGSWMYTSGAQQNNWVLQLVAPCDLTAGRTLPGEIQDAGHVIYRLQGDRIDQRGFSTKCLQGTQETISAVISNLPVGPLGIFDATYLFRITNTGNGKP